MAFPRVMTMSKWFNESYRGPGASSVFYEKWSQAKPHDMILPYTIRRTTFVSGRGNCTDSASVNGYPWMFTTASDCGSLCILYSNPNSFSEIRDGLAACTNKARAKFIEKMGANAQLMVDILERRQTMEMLGKRITQVDEVLRLIKNLALSAKSPKQIQRELANALRLGRANKARRRELISRARQAIIDWRGSSRSIGALWLELHFGWEQLVKDVFETIQVLDSIPPTAKLRCTAREKVTFKRINNYTPRQGSVLQGTAIVQATVFGKFKVTNPNLFKARALGLTNPASWAWELIPFSFVVDWFFTVDQWLGQWDEFLGVQLVDGGYSHFFNGQAYGIWRDGIRNESAEGLSRALYLRRYTNLPSVTLGRKIVNKISPVRAITAISLLTQFLGKSK